MSTASIASIGEPNSGGSDNGTQNKNTQRQEHLKKVQAVLHVLWQILKSKWTLFVSSFIFVMYVSTLANIYNETGSEAFLLGCLAFILSNLFIYFIAGICQEINPAYMKNFEKFAQLKGCPIEYFFSIYWHQFASTCLSAVVISTYVAGSFSENGKTEYAKIINGVPLTTGQSIWVIPSGFANHIITVPKKQNVWLPGLKATTADGALIVGTLNFEGRLSDDNQQWFNFDKKKEDFIVKLKEAYVRAVKATKLADLDKPLIIAFETSKESADTFAGSAIVPSESGTIEAYGFKVLAKQASK